MFLLFSLENIYYMFLPFYVINKDSHTARRLQIIYCVHSIVNN